jgi:hypothetical protein
LPALYEIRNNRGVGHVGGDVDPNHMDASAVLAMSSWVMAELIRVFHSLSVHQAQEVVDSITERRTPLIWAEGDMKRVLNPSLPLKSQVLVLLAGSPTPVTIADLLRWSDYANKGYFMRLLRGMHKDRLVELAEAEGAVQILPPGSVEVEAIAAAEAANR